MSCKCSPLSPHNTGTRSPRYTGTRPSPAPHRSHEARCEVAATFCGTTSVGREPHIQRDHRRCPGNCRHSRHELVFLVVNPCPEHHVTIWLHFIENFIIFQSCFLKLKTKIGQHHHLEFEFSTKSVSCTIMVFNMETDDKKTYFRQMSNA